MTKQRAAIVAIGLALMGCVACDPVATVSYRQIGACGSIKGDTATVFFNFTQIDNSGGTAPATFDPYATWIQGHQDDGMGRGYIDQGLTGQLAVNLGFPAVQPITVGAGQIVPYYGIGVVTVNTDSHTGSIEANTTPYFLVGSGALAIKLNPNQNTWPVTPSCQDVSIKNAQ